MFGEKRSQVVIKLLDKMNWEIQCLVISISHKSLSYYFNITQVSAESIPS